MNELNLVSQFNSAPGPCNHMTLVDVVVPVAESAPDNDG